MANRHHKKHHTNKWFFAAYIGFFAGLIWGGLKLLEHYFHFTSLMPGFLIEPFFLHSFLMTWTGLLIGWGAFIGMSVAASLLYALVLAKFRGPWLGVAYGLAWWAAIFLLIGPITGMTEWILYMDLNTILTDASLFAVWGLFIGYSIAFEFTDERAREPIGKRRKLV
ncbi:MULTISPECIES: YqhR family membrane protein [Paenibacillus]|uniref:YqhR family membrane protein n=1 Tax=Paenibacillus TaxID=44249 RepID=UPI0022B8E787|nr:YqhR family membrane protein [Paenibacillus caseinilyticus]MCZ8520667.1 YqhR family membrane protein [Paenibacillus caseinilyticus]